MISRSKIRSAWWIIEFSKSGEKNWIAPDPAEADARTVKNTEAVAAVERAYIRCPSCGARMNRQSGMTRDDWRRIKDIAAGALDN